MLSSQKNLIIDNLDIKQIVLALSLWDNFADYSCYKPECDHWGLGSRTTITNQDIFDKLDYIVFPNLDNLPR